MNTHSLVTISHNLCYLARNLPRVPLSIAEKQSHDGYPWPQKMDLSFIVEARHLSSRPDSRSGVIKSQEPGDWRPNFLAKLAHLATPNKEWPEKIVRFPEMGIGFPKKKLWVSILYLGLILVDMAYPILENYHMVQWQGNRQSTPYPQHCLVNRTSQFMDFTMFP